jgi:hypothetical protein
VVFIIPGLWPSCQGNVGKNNGNRFKSHAFHCNVLVHIYNPNEKHLSYLASILFVTYTKMSGSLKKAIPVTGLGGL